MSRVARPVPSRSLAASTFPSRLAAQYCAFACVNHPTLDVGTTTSAPSLERQNRRPHSSTTASETPSARSRAVVARANPRGAVPPNSSDAAPSAEAPRFTTAVATTRANASSPLARSLDAPATQDSTTRASVLERGRRGVDTSTHDARIAKRRRDENRARRVVAVAVATRARARLEASTNASRTPRVDAF
jgi:hypothetical protein